MKIPIIYIPNKSMSFVVEKMHYTINNSHVAWKEAVSFYKKKNYDGLIRLANPKQYIERYSYGDIKIYDGLVTYKGEKLHNYIADRLLEFISEGVEFTDLAKFLDNVMKNPYPDIQDSLYKFLELNNLALTDDGCFLAFKLVKKDGSPVYHAGTLYDADGQVVPNYFSSQIFTYPVDRIRRTSGECSTEGIYVGNKTYWNSNFDEDLNYNGDGIMLIAKINPMHVVNVPHSDATKIVVSRMEIVDQYKDVKGVVVRKVTSNKAIKRASKESKTGGPARDKFGRFMKKKTK